MVEGDDPDILRIYIATDTHLGFCERDPLRGDDSFAAFEEVLNLAKKSSADLLLHGGDLYDEAKPSPHTVNRTMDMLSRYCLGDDPVAFEVISDAQHNFRNPSQMPNWMHPHLNVGMPVLMIHGNHDCPTKSGEFEPLSALDQLATANLINYFGVSDRVDSVDISPVLIRKGNTKVAIYGLGWQRDDRLNRMWTKKQVRFLRPTEEDGQSAFFNIFVVHQNREVRSARAGRSVVYDSMIPNWMDVVVWGHEHECRVQSDQPEQSAAGSFRVMQLGSSVATALVPGEAKRKHVALLEVRQDQWRMQPHALQQVRPFAHRELSLRNIPELDKNDPKVEDEIVAVLESQVEEMIQEALEQDAGYEQEDGIDVQERRGGYTYKIKERHRPLLRLRVEHAGFPAIRVSQFASRFMDRIANPGDMLMLHKKKSVAPPVKDEDGAAGASRPNVYRSMLLDDDDNLDDGAGVENISKMVALRLAEDKQLDMKLLVTPELTGALEEFVERNASHAIEDMVEKTLIKTQRKLFGNRGVSNDNLDASVDVVRGEATQKAERIALRKRMQALPEEGAGEHKAGARGRDRGGEAEVDSDEEVMNVLRERKQKNNRQRMGDAAGEGGAFDVEKRTMQLEKQYKAPELKKLAADLGLKKTGNKTDVAARIAKYEATQQPSSSKGNAGDDDDADDGYSRRAPPSRAKPKPVSRAAKKKSREWIEEDDEEEDDDIVDDDDVVEVKASSRPRAKSQRSSPRGRKRARVNYAEAQSADDDDDDVIALDDDDDDDVQPAGKRKGWSRSSRRVLEDSQPASASAASQRSSQRSLPSWMKPGGRKASAKKSQASQGGGDADYSSLANAFR